MMIRATAIAAWVLMTAVAAGQPGVVAGTEGKALPAAPATDAALTIVILGDRTTGRDWGLPYLVQAVEDVNVIGPDAVFTVGDMVQGYTRSMAQYEAETAEFQRIVSGLEAPLYPLPGNHDVIPGTRDPKDRRFEARYQELVGPLYFAVELDEATVVSLYSDEALESRVEFSDEQIAWAGERVSAAAGRDLPLIVLMHKPAWRYRDSRWEEIHGRLAGFAEETGRSVTVLAGHFHSMQKDEARDGVEYLLVGTCGGMIDQHPLTGQLQHLSIVTVKESGAVSVRHHPVGSTLPADFIDNEDQSRANRLKSSDEAVRIETVLEQPWGRPLSGEMTVAFSNPLDVPIRVSGALVREEPGFEVMEDRLIASRTQRDMFNPEVTDIATPLRLTEGIEDVAVGPGETVRVTVGVRCEGQREPIRPPQMDFRATFMDSRGREVPVVIRRRIPLRSRVLVTDRSDAEFRISAWEFSVYDYREEDPRLQINASEGRLNVGVLAFDEVLSFYPVEDAATRVRNPLSDVVVIEMGGEEGTALLIEPGEEEPRARRIRRSAEGAWSLVEEPKVSVRVVRRDRGYAVLAQIPLEMAGRPGEEIAFNVRVGDNDETYHTQWRTWCDVGAGCTVVLPASFSGP